MAKKITRHPKSINVSCSPNTTHKDIENIPGIKELIFNETYEAIKDIAPYPSKTIAQLFEINNSGYVVELEEKQWIPALEKAIVFYEGAEEYEKCVLLKTLINQIHERRNTRSEQNTKGSKQYSKRKNSSKTKKIKHSNSK